MDHIKKQIENLKLSTNTIPIAFFLSTILGFGLLSPWLGYYQDDWPYVFYAFNKGIPSLVEELFYDSRINAAWLYISAFQLLGFRPLYWHLTALVMRWLTGTILWMAFKRIWPNHIHAITFVILLFLVHPFFLIQPAAVNSILYWAGFILFALSMWVMVGTHNVNGPVRHLGILAVVLSGIHIYSFEYFVGIEFIRPIILYWISNDPKSNALMRLKRTMIEWIPYLIVLVSFIFWRIYFFTPPPGGDRNNPILISNIITNTVPTLTSLARTMIQDTIIIAVTSWFRVIRSEAFIFSTLFDWIVFSVTILVMILSVYYFNRMQPHPKENDNNDPSFPTQLLLLGIAIIILGILPAWMIGQDIYSHKNQFAASRFGIGSTLGAAMLLTWIIIKLIDNRKNQIIAISILISLGINFHLYNAKGFQFSWEKQLRFYQQLIWRAPNVEIGTAFITDQEILPYMGQYAVSFGLMTAYQPGNVKSPPYWYFPFYYSYPEIDELINGIPITDGRVSMTFSGWSKDILIFYFEPGLDRCLWILRPVDVNLRLVDEDLRRLSSISALNQIHPDMEEKLKLPEQIFGTLPDRGWCYYFEKADLARQFSYWDDIIRLWEQANHENEYPGNGFEYIPFIEAFGHAGNWNQVAALTKSAKKITQGLEPSLCTARDKLASETPASPERDKLLEELRNNLSCDNF